MNKFFSQSGFILSPSPLKFSISPGSSIPPGFRISPDSSFVTDPASLPEGEGENSPGWSAAQSGESVPIEFARPVGTERNDHQASSGVPAIALRHKTVRQPRPWGPSYYKEWRATPIPKEKEPG